MSTATIPGRTAPKLTVYLRRILRELSAHPISGRNVPAALVRVSAYQILSRVRSEFTWPWIGGSKLVLARGMRGASGNIYSGLAEFAEMGFFLHFLREGDLFFDLGANIGSYTVLAAKACGARTLAVEPDPSTLRQLRRNIEANGIEDLVTVKPYALAERNGVVEFWTGWDTSNRIATPGDGQATQTLPCRVLDDLAPEAPIAIKMDLEGGEEGALMGMTRTLSSPRLQALAIEQVDGDSAEILAAHGFKRVYYDPTTRDLGDTANGLRVADELYVRDIEFVRARLRAAPKRKVCGYQL